jgi:hypothetical protein
MFDESMNRIRSESKAEELINALCANCREIDLQSFVSGRAHYIKTNIFTVSGAEEGCPLCRLVLPGWEDGLGQADHFRPVICDALVGGESVKVVEGFNAVSYLRSDYHLVFVAEEGTSNSLVSWSGHFS